MSTGPTVVGDVDSKATASKTRTAGSAHSDAESPNTTELKNIPSLSLQKSISKTISTFTRSVTEPIRKILTEAKDTPDNSEALSPNDFDKDISEIQIPQELQELKDGFVLLQADVQNGPIQLARLARVPQSTSGNNKFWLNLWGMPHKNKKLEGKYGSYMVNDKKQCSGEYTIEFILFLLWKPEEELEELWQKLHPPEGKGQATKEDHMTDVFFEQLKQREEKMALLWKNYFNAENHVSILNLVESMEPEIPTLQPKLIEHKNSEFLSPHVKGKHYTCLSARKMKVTLVQDWHLNHFPFDHQILRLVLRPRESVDKYFLNPIRDVERGKMMSFPSSISPHVGLQIPEWETFKPRFHSAMDDFSMNRSYSLLVLGIPILRNPSFHLWATIFPLWVLQLLSFSVYFIDFSEGDAGNRLAVLQTLLLTAVAFQASIAESVPHISYRTKSDIFFLGTIFLQISLNMWVCTVALSARVWPHAEPILWLIDLLGFVVLAVIWIVIVIAWYCDGSRRNQKAQSDFKKYKLPRHEELGHRGEIPLYQDWDKYEIEKDDNVGENHRSESKSSRSGSWIEFRRSLRNVLPRPNAPRAPSEGDGYEAVLEETELTALRGEEGGEKGRGDVGVGDGGGDRGVEWLIFIFPLSPSSGHVSPALSRVSINIMIVQLSKARTPCHTLSEAPSTSD
eukprot:g42311.t1